MENRFKFSTSVLVLPLFFVLLIWIVYWFEVQFHYDFAEFGVLPRTISGLKGVVFSPFIHGSVNHLANNSLPLLTLLAALRFFYRELSFKVIFFGILLSGLITWIIGRQNYHIGASSLIYVLVSFIFFEGIFSKYYRLVALSLTIVVWYGGMIWYVFPTANTSISWEGHLAGFITGFILSRIFETPDYHAPKLYEWQKPDYNPENDDFMKNFDENGNFVSQSSLEKSDIEINQDESNNAQVIYHFKDK